MAQRDLQFRRERTTMMGEKIATSVSLLWSENLDYATGIEVAESRFVDGGWKPRNVVRVHHSDAAELGRIFLDVAAENSGHLV